MSKAFSEIADSIPEPGGGKPKNGILAPAALFEGIISGKKYNRSSHWWAMYKNQVYGESINKSFVSSRCYNGWSELEATIAPKGADIREARKMLASLNILVEEKTKKQRISNFLSRAW